MSTRTWLLITIVAASLTGCGVGPGGPAPVDKSTSTAELATILAEQDPARAHMLMPRKIEAIETLAERPDEALPILLKTAQNENEVESVRFLALETIGQFRRVPEDQIPALLDLMRGENFIMLDDLLERSCQAAPADKVAPLLVEFVTDDSIDYDNRQFVALILLDVDEPAAEAAGVVKGSNPLLPNEKFMPDIRPVQK